MKNGNSHGIQPIKHFIPFILKFVLEWHEKCLLDSVRKCSSEYDNYNSCAFSMIFFYETVMNFKWIGLKSIFDCHQSMQAEH